MKALRTLRAPWLRGGLVAVLYVALGFVLFWPVWSAGAASHMQVGGDQWRNVWFARWTVHALSGGHSVLYSDAANYPGGVNVLLNAGAPFLSVLFSPITALFGPIATYNLASTLALPLSALSAYLLLRRFVEWRIAAFLGGLLYGFGPEEVVHGLGGHVNLSFSPFVPLIVLLIHEAVVWQRPRWGVLGTALGVAVACQFFVSSEVLLETVLSLVIALLVAAILFRDRLRQVAPYGLKAVGSAVVVAAVILVWPVWTLAKGPAHVSGPVQLVAQGYRANLVSPVIPDSLQLVNVHSLVATANHFASTPVENGSYLGLPLLLLVLAGLVWRRRDRLMVIASVTGIAAFVLSMGGAMTIRSSPALSGGGHAVGKVPLPESLLAKLPLLENLIPARFALQVTLCVALAGSLLLDRIYKQLSARGRSKWQAGGAPVVLAVIGLVPLLPAGLLSGVQKDVTPAGFNQVASRVAEGGVAVVFPFPSGTFPNPVMWQVDAAMRFKMPGGSFFVPQGPSRHVAYNSPLGYTLDTRTGVLFTELAEGQTPEETPAVRAELLDEWRSWHVKSVIAVPSACPNPALAMQFLTWLVGGPSTRAGDTYGWYF